MKKILTNYEYPTIKISDNDIKDYVISIEDEYIEEAVIVRDAMIQ